MDTAYEDFTEKELSDIEVAEIIRCAKLLVKRYTGKEIWSSTLAELKVDPIARARKLQKELNCGDIMHNSVRCLACNTTIQSMTVHDFVSCSCGDVSVDGGSWYCKRLYEDGAEFEPLSECWPWVAYGEKA